MKKKDTTQPGKKRVTRRQREIAEAVADRDWWMVVGREFGGRLFGWSNRSSAAFDMGSHTCYLDGYVAEAVHRLIAASKRPTPTLSVGTGSDTAGVIVLHDDIPYLRRASSGKRRAVSGKGKA